MFLLPFLQLRLIWLECLSKRRILRRIRFDLPSLSTFVRAVHPSSLESYVLIPSAFSCRGFWLRKLFPHLSLPSQLLSTKKVLDAACSKCLRLVTQPSSMETTPPCIQTTCISLGGHCVAVTRTVLAGAVFSEADKANRSSKFGALLFFGMPGRA